MTLTVVIPCLNEELSIVQTISNVKKQVPEANIIVVDNGSTDSTKEKAARFGATVLNEPNLGKGFAIRKAISSLPRNSSAFFMVDGDDTYDLSEIKNAYNLVKEQGYDLVIGKRVVQKNREKNVEFRIGHKLGNKILSAIFRLLFAVPISDTLSGWRMMSIGFISSFPQGATGFEIETELNVHAYHLKASVIEIPVKYNSRKMNSVSKLRTYKDGWLILRRNLRLFRNAKPLIAFSLLSAPWLLAGIFIFLQVFNTYLLTGLVPQFPRLIVAVGFFTLASNLWITGMILERLQIQRAEICRLEYNRSPLI